MLVSITIVLYLKSNNEISRILRKQVDLRKRFNPLMPIDVKIMLLHEVVSIF